MWDSQELWKRPGEERVVDGLIDVWSTRRETSWRLGHAVLDHEESGRTPESGSRPRPCSARGTGCEGLRRSDPLRAPREEPHRPKVGT